MDYSQEYLRKQLALQGITASETDLRNVQRIMSFIRRGEERLDAFPVESQKIILTMDMAAVR